MHKKPIPNPCKVFQPHSVAIYFKIYFTSSHNLSVNKENQNEYINHLPSKLIVTTLRR